MLQNGDIVTEIKMADKKVYFIMNGKGHSIKNIVFSSTRQWNPGDEIILFGVRNLLDEIGIKYNPLLFNRNPDVRNEYVNMAQNMAESEDSITTRIKTAMKDNSIKPWQSYENIDAIVFAGTPEWQSMRSRELFAKAVEYRVPVFFIGIDFAWTEKTRLISSVLEKSKLLSVRNPDVVDSFRMENKLAVCKVCPSLFSSLYEKKVEKVDTIGLIYRAQDGVLSHGNGWSEEQYYAQVNLYRRIAKEYPQCRVIIICHYIDEVFLAEKEFADCEVRYSYDSAEYIKIYAECDLVVGSRIHGIGIASSLCIPSISISYDNRAGTLKLLNPLEEQFAKMDNDFYSKVQWLMNNINFANKQLKEYKNKCKADYCELLTNCMNFERVNYDYTFVGIDTNGAKHLRNKLLQMDKMVEKNCVGIIIQELKDAIKSKIRGKRIIIKGAGLLTERLLPVICPDSDVIAIADNQKTRFGVYKCITDKEITNYTFDYVLIFSYLYEKEMVNNLRVYCSEEKILSIYDVLRDNYREIDYEVYVSMMASDETERK